MKITQLGPHREWQKKRGSLVCFCLYGGACSNYFFQHYPSKKGNSCYGSLKPLRRLTCRRSLPEHGGRLDLAGALERASERYWLCAQFTPNTWRGDPGQFKTGITRTDGGKRLFIASPREPRTPARRAAPPRTACGRLYSSAPPRLPPAPPSAPPSRSSPQCARHAAAYSAGWLR